MTSSSPPFGALEPTPWQERFRALARMLPENWLGRRLASVLLGPAGGRARRAYDVGIFGNQKARLHPFDNICEKRVFLTPQHWDARERALLAARIASHCDDDFYFADVGANVGLYTLFARSEAAKAGKKFRAVCVEADPDMRDRLSFNLAASGAAEDVVVLPYAATAADGPVTFSVNRQSRGLSRIAADGERMIEGRTLKTLLTEAPRIDAMKIDIEGHEYQALSPFFRDAPRALWPRLVIMEVSHEADGGPARKLLEEKGYRPVLETGLNAVLANARTD